MTREFSACVGTAGGVRSAFVFATNAEEAEQKLLGMGYREVFWVL